jgi:hypothetical protein
MAWTNSKIFRAYLADIIGNTTAMDLNTDASIKVALYDNDITPDNDVTSANTAYNVGQWVATGNEVVDATNWVAGGRALSGATIDTGTADKVMFDAADLSGGGTVTLTNAHGCLVYDDTIATPVADQGICYNYFGGAQSVTAGTFTVSWSATNGIFSITL